MSQLPNPEDLRTPDHSIEPLFVRRWSPRALSGEPVTQAELNRLLEAARWAPSSFNEQEWRFLYAHRSSPHWETFFNLLMEPNKVWCGRGAVLAVIASKKTFTVNGRPNRVHLFDCGAAFENICLQATTMGLVVHGMGGFDAEAARTSLNVPEDFDVAAMFVVGHPGDPAELPEELRAREKPSSRKTIAEFSCEGPFAV